MRQPTLFNARAAGHQAALRCADKADALAPGWLERACQSVVRYAHEAPGPFLLEDARAAAEADGLKARDGRAWGAVIQRLKRDGRIVFAGYGAAKSSHGSPKCAWRAA